MWPFKSVEQEKRDAAKLFASRIEPASRLVRERWLAFLREMPFHSDVALSEQIGFFIEPMIQGIRTSFPELAKSPDEALFFLFLQGIMASDSHPRSEMNEAFRDLGVDL